MNKLFMSLIEESDLGGRIFYRYKLAMMDGLSM